MGQRFIDIENARIEDLESDFDSLLELFEAAREIKADMIMLAIMLALYDGQRLRPEEPIRDWLQERAEKILKALYAIGNRSVEIQRTLEEADNEIIRH